MKLLMIMIDSSHKEEVEKLLDEHQVPGYTELPNVLGKGQSGRKFGSRAFPGSNTLYFTVVARDTYEALHEELKALDARCGPDEGLTAYLLNAEMVV
jgi:hypothetical protein